MNARFLRWTLLPMAAALLAVATVSAQHGPAKATTHHDQGGPHEVCQLFPEGSTGHEFHWALPRNYDGGGTSHRHLQRDSPLGSGTKEKEVLRADPDTPTTPIRLDGHTEWRGFLRLEGGWQSSLPTGRDLSEDDLLIEGVVLLNGAYLAIDQAKPIRITNPTSPLQNYQDLRIVVPFTWTPRPTHPGQTATLDQVSTEFFFRLSDPDPVATPGTLKVRLELHGGFHPGSMLEIPGRCTDADRTFPPHGDRAHPHGAHHMGESKFAEAETLACTAVPSHCPQGSATQETEGNPSEEAFAPQEPSNVSPPIWGPAAVAASIGLAGFSYFPPGP